ncbi:hypothetical protein HAZT_HAZT004782 [Hyalella azteca]|uniref:NTR domain-containing protein n=1 Tax=Hyalella azteca TaxID=294128 RepID=A0A6A0H1V9_HYAAZ|nr:hypothetical protein HAZT_HAZT004782 [Hyalella azteca]
MFDLTTSGVEIPDASPALPSPVDPNSQRPPGYGVQRSAPPHPDPSTSHYSHNDVNARHAYSYAAVLGYVTNSEVGPEYTRFDLQIRNVFKRTRSVRVRRGVEQLWVKNADLACKCPKLKIGSEYLILGKQSGRAPRPGLVVNQRSIVLEWRNSWTLRMRRLDKKASQAKCRDRY